MSELRKQLIQEGKLVPVETKRQIERLAEQLYNVLRNKARELDSAGYESNDEEIKETWQEVEDDFKEIMRAQARYVISTYTENDRLREKNRKLELEIKDLREKHHDLVEGYDFGGPT